MGMMATSDFVALIHLVGFVTGVALYGMLAVMTWRSVREDRSGSASRIPVLAAVLGLIWNAGALLVFGAHDFGVGELSPWLTTLSYAALGFLPAVVVDSATRSPQSVGRPVPIALAAYGLSAAAAVMQATATADHGVISSTGLLTLTLGYCAILLVLGATSRRRSGSQRALTAVALAAFAVSALHLSHHTTVNESWLVVLIGHHASLPLVLVILYQDYRFALADLFLKRAIAILVLVAVVVACYALVVPLGSTPAVLPIGMPGVLLAAWIGTALFYPTLRRGVDRFVDRVMLGRVDYRELRGDIATAIARVESPHAAIELTCERLRKALTALDVRWTERESESPEAHGAALVTLNGGGAATISVPTSEHPAFTIAIGALANGRRLLSDDVALLEHVALIVARRIDELRVAQERLERDVREYEMQQLAAEAELRALRAQLNPHFLFNALTTIGYLVRTSPPRAIETLYQLTALLRAVLRRATGEFVTLKDELQIVDAYLAIEQARFEDRLQIERNVPEELRELPIPPLVLQPIVENAIKHGIATRRSGGVVRIEAISEVGAGGPPHQQLRLRVSDTGPGVPASELARRRLVGVGLSNVERRLHRYFGDSGRLSIDSVPGRGTIVEVVIPIAARDSTTDETAKGTRRGSAPRGQARIESPPVKAAS